MQKFMDNKMISGAALLALLLALWYGLFRTEPLPPGTPGNSAVGADLLKISAELSEANLDQEIFSDPEYLYLTDFSTAIQPQPTGRANPFDIIGR